MDLASWRHGVDAPRFVRGGIEEVLEGHEEDVRDLVEGRGARGGLARDVADVRAHRAAAVRDVVHDVPDAPHAVGFESDLLVGFPQRGREGPIVLGVHATARETYLAWVRAHRLGALDVEERRARVALVQREEDGGKAGWAARAGRVGRVEGAQDAVHGRRASGHGGESRFLVLNAFRQDDGRGRGGVAVRRDLAPYATLGALILVLALVLAVPASRAWLDAEVVAPVRAQATGEGGGAYSIASMVAWAVAGAVAGWVAYDAVFLRLRFEPGRAFFAALAPFLVFGPLFHAVLAAGALPSGSLLAYLAAEPPVYLTTAVLALVALVAGRALSRPVLVPLALGLVCLAPLLVVAAQRMDASTLGRLGVVLALALVPAAMAAYAFRAREVPLAAGAVVGAHALDGATTWMVLRDPFGLGFGSFSEKNPVSLGFVEMSNGWPYYALKLALPVVILLVVKKDETEERTRAFLLFGVFVLGYGPGASNLLQVLLG